MENASLERVYDAEGRGGRCNGPVDGLMSLGNVFFWEREGCVGVERLWGPDAVLGG